MITNFETRLLRKTFVEIDLSALRTNYDNLRALLGRDDFFCPMVKGNAYGHGDLVVARALRQAGAQFLGVGLIEEGIRLREGGDVGEILAFCPFDERSVGELIDHSLTPVIGMPYCLEIYASELRARGKSGRVHLKFNTGMNRLGFSVDQLSWVVDFLKAVREIEVVGVCSHLQNADDFDDASGETKKQLEQFQVVLAGIKKFEYAHIWNSAGLIKWHQSLGTKKKAKKNMGARPGIAIYGLGVNSFSDLVKPILSWKSQIVSFQNLKSADGISYGPKWRAKRPTRVGVLPIGYADGFWRDFTNKGEVLVRGKRAPVIGTVCMDYTMVDLTDIESKSGSTALGTEVVLIGKQGKQSITAEDLANQLGTISYEVVTRISERVPRVYSE